MKQLTSTKNPFPSEWQVKKHVALIHASGALTKVEKLLVNVLLFNAYDDLLTKTTHTIPSKFLTNLLGWDASNNLERIKQAMKLLGSRLIEFNLLEDGKTSWEFNHFISWGKIKDGVCSYRYDPDMAKLLYEPEVYAMVRASLEYKLSGSYSMNLYENCVRFKNTKHKTTGWWTIERFKILMGATMPLYDDFRYLRRNAINKPIEDINKNTDINLSVEFKKEGRNIVEVRFLIEPKNENDKNTPQKIFSDADLDQNADIKNNETYKRLISAGLGDKLAQMYVLKDEAKARAILNSTEDDINTGKIKKPSAYIKTVFDSDSVIVDPKLKQQEKINKQEKEKASTQNNDEILKEQRQETNAISTKIKSLPDDEKRDLINKAFSLPEQEGKKNIFLEKVDTGKLGIADIRLIAIETKKHGIIF
jgi:plasmid replication initiation protein